MTNYWENQKKHTAKRKHKQPSKRRREFLFARYLYPIVDRQTDRQADRKEMKKNEI